MLDMRGPDFCQGFCYAETTHVQNYYYSFFVRAINGWHRDIDYITLKSTKMISFSLSIKNFCSLSLLETRLCSLLS